ncbi:MAG: hypothetical protein IKU01_11300 [Bacteroidales bacterium]|nr:hypothetical protein [Bacteroidales bacterium]
MMKSVRKKFLISLLSLFGILWGTSMMVSVYAPQYITPNWHYLLLLFTTVSAVIFRKAIDIRKKNDAHKMINFNMIATILKLIVYLTIIVIYVVNNPEDKITFIVTFLTYYLCFSFFETFMLVRNNNNKDE